ncbi:MAG: hypothetical protein IT305_02810 [Chloroflexi bacterium]|nr:hypothetical protein [Chloroflexota bacterium]
MMTVPLSRRFARFVLALAATALVVAGCTPAAPSTPSGAQGVGERTAANVPSPGGRVVVGSFADAKVLNPVLSTDVSSAEVWNRIYASLIQVDRTTAQPKPYLAQSFTAGEDGKSLSFVLRDGLTWSDGSPLTGDDVRFTAEAVMRSKKSARKSIFQSITGARDYAEGKAETISGIVVDGKTVTFQLEKVSCPSLTDIGLFGIIPKSVFGKYLDPKDASRNLDEAAENAAPPLASGPFVFKEWRPNDQIVLARNDHYALGRVMLDEWVYKILPDATALAAALKTGEVDVARAEAKDLEDLKRSENLTLHPYLAPGYTYIAWNQMRGGKEFFQSVAIRQALAYGLNVDRVVERVLYGEGQRMLAHTPPTSWAYDAEGMNSYAYNPQKARDLIESEGWTRGPDGIYQKDGQKLEFTLVTNSGSKTREALLQIAVEQYREIGVNVIPRTESFEALTDRVNKSKDPVYGEQGGRDYDAAILGWSLGPDPEAFATWHSSQVKGGMNQVGLQDEQIDRALEAGRSVCGLEQRREAYKTLNLRLNELQPYNFGFAANTLLFVNERVQAVEPGPFPNVYNGYLWNVDQWWVK